MLQMFYRRCKTSDAMRIETALLNIITIFKTFGQFCDITMIRFDYRTKIDMYPSEENALSTRPILTYSDILTSDCDFN